MDAPDQRHASRNHRVGAEAQDRRRRPLTRRSQARIA
jgi:hypothetical protein